MKLTIHVTDERTFDALVAYAKRRGLALSTAIAYALCPGMGRLDPLRRCWTSAHGRSKRRLDAERRAERRRAEHGR